MNDEGFKRFKIVTGGKWLERKVSRLQSIFEVGARYAAGIWATGLVITTIILTDFDAFWLDELTSYWFSSGNDVASVFERMLRRSDPHPPGYQVLLYFWLKLPEVAHSAIAVRFTSVLSLIIALASGAALAVRVARTSFGGIFFVFIYGALAFVPYYGSELRSYMMLQAGFLLLLLGRDLRLYSERYRRIGSGIELSSAFIMATSHYIGALLVVVVAILDLLRLLFDGAKKISATWACMFLRAGWISLVSLVGAIFSAAWLLLASRHGSFRKLPDPTLEKFINDFLRVWGAKQFVVLTVFLILLTVFSVWLLKTAACKTCVEKAKSVGFRCGFFQMLLALGLVLTISIHVSLLQQRTLLFFLPPVALALSVWAATVTSWGGPKAILVFVFALGFPAAAIPGVVEHFSSQARSGENFGEIVSLAASGQLVCYNDDIAQKLLDAIKIRRWDGPIVEAPPIFVISSQLKTGAGRPLSELKRKGRVVLACPHCHSKAQNNLRELKIRLRLKHCVKPKVARRDIVTICEF